MGQTYASITVGTDTGSTIFTTLKDRTDTLRSHFSGSSSPGSPVDGQTWADSTTAGDLILSFYNGTTWVEIGAVLHTDIALGTSAIPKQLLYGRLENRTGQITPAAAQIGRIYHFTTDSKARLVVSATVREVVLSGSNVDFIPVDVPAAAMERDATNPPTAATKGTTPTLRGWLFDAANELASFCVRVPQGYSADADCKLRLLCVLNQAETAGDDIDWTADLVTVEHASAEVVSKTSTAATIAQDMSTFVSDGACHAVDIVLDFDHADNPIAAGDLLCIQIHRTDLANCGGVIVVAAQVLFPLGLKVTE